jgi:hypothetical protein
LLTSISTPSCSRRRAAGSSERVPLLACCLLPAAYRLSASVLEWREGVEPGEGGWVEPVGGNRTKPGRGAYAAPDPASSRPPLRDRLRAGGGRLGELVTRSVAFEPLARPMVAGLPARCLKTTGGTAQEHASFNELQDGIVAVQAADGALQMPDCPGPETARKFSLRRSCNRSRRNILKIRRHGLLAPRDLRGRRARRNVPPVLRCNQEVCHEATPVKMPASRASSCRFVQRVGRDHRRTVGKATGRVTAPRPIVIIRMLR